MPRVRDELSAGEWAVLALLGEQPAHGFAIARAMAPGGDVGQVWAMRRPLVYRALETLEQREMIRPAGTVPSQIRPSAHDPRGDAGGHAGAGRMAEPAGQPRPRRTLAADAEAPVPHPAATPTLEPLLTAQRAQFSLQAERLTRRRVDAGRGVRPHPAAVAPPQHHRGGAVHRDAARRLRRPQVDVDSEARIGAFGAGVASAWPALPCRRARTRRHSARVPVRVLRNSRIARTTRHSSRELRRMARFSGLTSRFYVSRAARRQYAARCRPPTRRTRSGSVPRSRP